MNHGHPGQAVGRVSFDAVSLLTGAGEVKTAQEGSVVLSGLSKESKLASKAIDVADIADKESGLKKVLGKSGEILDPISYVEKQDWQGLLKHTGIDAANSKITSNTLEHVFIGQVEENGKRVGFHYEGNTTFKSDSFIIGDRKINDAHGVYQAENVQVKGDLKLTNAKDVKKNQLSTFYSRSWSETDVVKAIDEAWHVRQPKSGLAPGNTGWYSGESKSGVTIEMYINEDESIATAFPRYEEPVKIEETFP